MAEHSMPLSMAGAGRLLTVTEIIGGAGIKRRLSDLGLTPGVPVIVMSGCHPGPLLIDIRGSRLGLGFGVAHKIMVKEVENEQKSNCSCAGWQSQLR
jgi:ferrous iron transport protein A